ncbi:hypothetical protein [Streptomyces cavernae]|uniref:hypothetical protein n=1 Tax=Streptomyces cavernae TaxID=2259034 RepID=UPI000FEBD6C0|nr:hypothetical protein [Streptomyces cavernae]
MGVFARFRRKSKAASGTAEKASVTEAEAVVSTTDIAAATSETEPSGNEERAGDEDGAAAAVKGDASGEGVEIPKQQSAQEAADSGAGEAARR